MNICKEQVPKLKEIEQEHFCACHLYNEQRHKDTTNLYEFLNDDVDKYIYDDEMIADDKKIEKEIEKAKEDNVKHEGSTPPIQ